MPDTARDAEPEDLASEESAQGDSAPGDSGEVALGDLVVPGGYFVHGEKSTRTPFTPAEATGGDPGYRHCFTYRGGGSTLRRELLAMLGGAEHKVFVASLLVGDPAVRTALLDAADRLAGGVYVVAALHGKGIDRVISRVDCDGVAIDPAEFDEPLSELTREGVYVRGYRGCHAKFVVVDDRVALVSSANLVSEAFDESGENGVVVTGEERVAPLSRLFARLWQLSPWDVPPDRDAYAPVSRESGADAVTVEAPSPGTPGPVWTWGSDRHLLRAVRELVDSAKDELVLATDSMRDMAAKPELLLDRVRAAAERGVRVRLLMRARNDRALRAEAVAFAEAGAEVHADPLHRAKAVVADGTRGLLGSANLAGKPGLTSGIEVAMRLDGTPALGEALRFLEHVMAETPTRFVQDATVVRLAAGLGTPSLSPWPLPNTLSVVASDDDWQRLVLATGRGGPALFTTSGDEGPVLHVGVGRWRIRADGGGHRVELAEYGTSVQRAAEVLDGWLAEEGCLAANVDAPAGVERRGLCPATLVRQTTMGDVESGRRDLAG